MNYTQKPYQMISGQHEAQVRRYHKHVTPTGRVWLVADQEAAAENVYVHDPSERGDKWRGFGGATLTFPLIDGTEYVAKAPWHSNADALFAETGVDLRDKHFTFVVLAMSCEWIEARTTFVDVVYQDEKPILGSFNRYKDLIKQYPQAQFYYSESSGGSCSGPISAQDRK